MPASVRLAEELGDDVSVILASTGDRLEVIEEFALRRHWLGGPAMWAFEAPVTKSGGSIPWAVVLSSDGEVIFDGSPVHSKIRELIDEDLRDARRGPDGADSTSRAAWREFLSGDAADAIEKLEESDHESAPVVLAEIESRIERDLRRAAWTLDNGFLTEAAERIEDVVILTEETPFAERAEALAEELESEARKDERDAARKFDRLVEQLYEDGPSRNLERSLTRIAEDLPGTGTAARAARLARLAAED